MVATINLYQFVAAGPTIPWLLNFWRIKQREKLRCMSRHQDPSMVNLRDGHLNLAQGGHYNFAVTP